METRLGRNGSTAFTSFSLKRSKVARDSYHLSQSVAIVLLTAIIVDGEFDRREFQAFKRNFRDFLLPSPRISARACWNAMRAIRQSREFSAQKNAIRTICWHLSVSQQENLLHALLSILMADKKLLRSEILYFNFVSQTVRNCRLKYAGLGLSVPIKEHQRS